MLIKRDAVFTQKFPVFFLKRSRSVMRLLIIDVFHHELELALTDRKRTVPTLPRETPIPRVEELDPFRRRFLCVFDHARLR